MRLTLPRTLGILAIAALMTFATVHLGAGPVAAEGPAAAPTVEQLFPYSYPFTNPYSYFGSGYYPFGYSSYPYGYGYNPYSYSYPYATSYPYSYSAYATSPTFTPAQTIAAYAGEYSSSPGIPAPDNCWNWDSWCFYCTNNAGSDLCNRYPPARRPATTSAASTTPGVGTPGGAAPSATAVTTTAAATTTAGATTTVGVSQASGGRRILTDASGMTLYTLSTDSPGVSSCTGGCTAAWPPLTIASGSPTAPSGVTGTLATITRPDGSMQVAYNGMPLYRYARDRAPGDTNGQGVTDQWGTWSVAVP